MPQCRRSARGEHGGESPERARKRIDRTAEAGNWAASRGKPKYLLSGLLRCAHCGAHYSIATAHEYGCPSYANGAEAKHSPTARAAAKVFALLPRAAEEFRRQVVLGLDGNPREAMKARITLRELVCGRIDLIREGEKLYADYGLRPAALLQVAGGQRLGNRGSGGAKR